MYSYFGIKLSAGSFFTKLAACTSILRRGSAPHKEKTSGSQLKDNEVKRNRLPGDFFMGADEPKPEVGTCD